MWQSWSMVRSVNHMLMICCRASLLYKSLGGSRNPRFSYVVGVSSPGGVHNVVSSLSILIVYRKKMTGCTKYYYYYYLRSFFFRRSLLHRRLLTKNKKNDFFRFNFGIFFSLNYKKKNKPSSEKLLWSGFFKHLKFPPIFFLYCY